MRLVMQVFLTGAICAAAPASADSMRCDRWVVNEEATVSELLEKCGPPTEKTEAKEDVWGRNPAGTPIKLGVKATEKWIYKRSAGALPMLVVVVDNKIQSIERLSP